MSATIEQCLAEIQKGNAALEKATKPAGSPPVFSPPRPRRPAARRLGEGLARRSSSSAWPTTYGTADGSQAGQPADRGGRQRPKGIGWGLDLQAGSPGSPARPVPGGPDAAENQLEKSRLEDRVHKRSPRPMAEGAGVTGGYIAPQYQNELYRIQQMKASSKTLSRVVPMTSRTA
jgi:hypothetical protein